MTLRDFKAYFVLLVIGKLNPGLLGLEVGQKWMYTMREGQKRSTTGGWMESPQGGHKSQGSRGVDVG